LNGQKIWWRTTKVGFVTFMTLLAVGGGWWWFASNVRTPSTSGKAVAQQEPETISVDTGEVTVNRAVQNRVLTGTVEAVDKVTLSSRVTGSIQQLNVDEGDLVSAGDLIATVDVDSIQARQNQAQAGISQAQSAVSMAQFTKMTAQSQKNEAQAKLEESKAKLQEAQADLEDAKLDQRRMQNLARQGVVSQDRLDNANTRVEMTQARIEQIKANIEQAKSAIDQADAQMKQAQAQVEQAQAQVEAARAEVQRTQADLDYGRVVAPFDGVITKKHAAVGSMVGEFLAQPIVTIERTDRLWFTVQVPESLIDSIRVGQNIDVQIDAINDTVAGTVDQIVSAADPNSRSFQAKIAIEPTQNVIPGMFGRIRLQKSGDIETLVVPEEAVVERVGITGVYQVVDGKARFTKITPGAQEEGKLEVFSGLEKGDRVVLNPPEKIKDGMLVR
jgi:multidrug efflux pump subunit AcrA (membrane-fusion protein)